MKPKNQKPVATPAPDGNVQGHSREIGKLCALLMRTARLNLHRKPGPQLVALVQKAFALDTVAVFDADLDEVYRAGEPFESLEELVRSIYLFETVSDDSQTGLSRRVLRLGSLPVGALLMRGEISPETSSAVAALAAITFDRYHALANESRTEAARRAEQLRSSVLDGLAHAYKTPLTAIRAAASGLVEMGGLSPTQSGLLALIEEEAALLGQLTTRLLRTAKLDATDLKLHIEEVRILPLLEEVAAGLSECLAGLSLQLSVPRRNLSIRCDRGLLASLLTQLLENAGKYATQGTVVAVKAGRATDSAGEIVFSVHNRGPVIPAGDLERIFDRYYRSTLPSGAAPGTGVGLSIVKQAVLAHGGRVWAQSSRSKGTVFFAAIPSHPPRESAT